MRRAYNKNVFISLIVRCVLKSVAGVFFFVETFSLFNTQFHSIGQIKHIYTRDDRMNERTDEKKNENIEIVNFGLPDEEHEESGDELKSCAHE